MSVRPRPLTRASPVSQSKLKRRLGLTYLVLYGLGVTVGAGIYVLVGLTAAEAGVYAPLSFLLAALIVLFTGFSYAELTSRFPVSSGEAVYVREGFGRRDLALIIGLLVAASGIGSSATISIGAASYLSNLVPLNPSVLTAVLILSLGAIAAWGILESVTVAAILTLLEIGGLLVVIFYCTTTQPDILGRLDELVPPLNAKVWSGIMSGVLLAFFAFIGFEDLANIAEEAKNPTRNMPLSIFLTLTIATLLYLGVVSVVVLSVPMEALRKSSSPLLLVFEQAPPRTRLSFNLVAGLATVNGVLIQVIMSSRVLYGLAHDRHLPKVLAKVSRLTGTPLAATSLVVAIVLGLALFFPVGSLAEWTSRLALLVFALVNLSLLKLKQRKSPVGKDPYVVSIWMPILGFITSASLFGFSIVQMF